MRCRRPPVRSVNATNTYLPDGSADGDQPIFGLRMLGVSSDEWAATKDFLNLGGRDTMLPAFCANAVVPVEAIRLKNHRTGKLGSCIHISIDNSKEGCGGRSGYRATSLPALSSPF